MRSQTSLSISYRCSRLNQNRNRMEENSDDGPLRTCSHERRHAESRLSPNLGPAHNWERSSLWHGAGSGSTFAGYQGTSSGSHQRSGRRRPEDPGYSSEPSHKEHESVPTGSFWGDVSLPRHARDHTQLPPSP